MTRIVQASREIKGCSLDQIVAEKRWGDIDNLSLGRTFLLTILLTVNDGKGDNYMVNENGIIVGIDNDHILSCPVEKKVCICHLPRLYFIACCTKLLVIFSYCFL